MDIKLMQRLADDTFEKLQMMKAGIEGRLILHPDDQKIKDELSLVLKMIEQAKKLQQIFNDYK